MGVGVRQVCPTREGGSVDSGAEQCSKYHNSVNIITLYITVTAQTHKHLEENVNEE